MLDYGPRQAPAGVAQLFVPQSYPETYWVEAYTGYALVPGGVAFVCRMTGGHQAHIRIEAVADDILRVRMAVGLQHSNEPGPITTVEPAPVMLIAPSGLQSPPPDVTVREEEGQVVIATGSVVATVQRSPWRLSLRDNCGSGAADAANEPFFCQQVADWNVHAYETPPPGFDHNPETGGWRARETLVIAPDEAFYGLGEKFSRLNKRGQFLTSWATDALSVHTQRSYKNVPLLLSSRRYGLFINATEQILYELGSRSFVSACFTIDAPQLDYFVIRRPSLKEILKRYADLTGYASVPPKWSFGLWMSRLSYRSWREVEAVAQQLRQRDIPCDVIHIDPYWLGPENRWCDLEWDMEHFPDPEKVLQALRAQGFRVCLWISPYVPEGTAMFDQGTAQGFFVKASSTATYLAPPPWGPPGPNPRIATVDFTNPEACAWFTRRLKSLLQQGVAVFKTDFGEWAPSDGLYHSGESGAVVHNKYPLLYNRLVYEATRDVCGEVDALVWGRSAYAGSQRYPVLWGGDSYPSFEDMACQLRGGLSLGLSGVPFYSHDVGGFARQTTGEIYARWSQFGLLSSHSRCHGIGPREPWEFGPEVEAIFREFCRLRYRLLPYLYSEAHVSAATGLPMMRAMVLEFEHDRNVRDIDLQYMLGHALLVAPVFGGTRREVYLPDSTWFNFWTGEALLGGRWIEESCALAHLPLYVRAGSVIPMQQAIPYVDAPLSPDEPQLHLPIYLDPYETPRYPRQLAALNYRIHGAWHATITMCLANEDNNWSRAHLTFDESPHWLRLEIHGMPDARRTAVECLTSQSCVVAEGEGCFTLDVRGGGPLAIRLR
jgi:alpha-D-xyloside xylohydrolase